MTHNVVFVNTLASLVSQYLLLKKFSYLRFD